MGASNSRPLQLLPTDVCDCSADRALRVQEMPVSFREAHPLRACAPPVNACSSADSLLSLLHGRLGSYQRGLGQSSRRGLLVQRDDTAQGVAASSSSSSWSTPASIQSKRSDNSAESPHHERIEELILDQKHALRVAQARIEALERRLQAQPVESQGAVANGDVTASMRHHAPDHLVYAPTAREADDHDTTRDTHGRARTARPTSDSLDAESMKSDGYYENYWTDQVSLIASDWSVCLSLCLCLRVYMCQCVSVVRRYSYAIILRTAQKSLRACMHILTRMCMSYTCMHTKHTCAYACALTRNHARTTQRISCHAQDLKATNRCRDPITCQALRSCY